MNMTDEELNEAIEDAFGELITAALNEEYNECERLNEELDLLYAEAERRGI